MAKSLSSAAVRLIWFQSIKGFQRFCGPSFSAPISIGISFQSLKGFQRFCGYLAGFMFKVTSVSIPKRVSEVLWRQPLPPAEKPRPRGVSIPKRVSEVLWLYLWHSPEAYDTRFNP